MSHPDSVTILRGKKFTPLQDEETYDDYSDDTINEDEYYLCNYSERYKKKLRKYCVELRQSKNSGEGYRSLKDLHIIGEYRLMEEKPICLKMCKKNNLSLFLNKTLKLFNDRLKIGDDTEKSELYYKKLLFEHGAYILININTGSVCAAGVMDNGYKFFSKPW